MMMKSIPATAVLLTGLTLFGFSAASLKAEEKTNALQITRAGTQPSRVGPLDLFSGTVRIDPLVSIHAPSRVAASYVTFEPGARTAWHTHPLGQALIITAGLGWVQQEGGAVEEVKAGDVVWIPPGMRHWHGASSTTAMTHIAITEALDGKNSDWMEKVNDTQYHR
jgi:quercetin dioxygenase-like cupin family protein